MVLVEIACQHLGEAAGRYGIRLRQARAQPRILFALPKPFHGDNNANAALAKTGSDVVAVQGTRQEDDGGYTLEMRLKSDDNPVTPRPRLVPAQLLLIGCDDVVWPKQAVLGRENGPRAPGSFHAVTRLPEGRGQIELPCRGWDAALALATCNEIQVRTRETSLSPCVSGPADLPECRCPRARGAGLAGLGPHGWTRRPC